MSQLAQILIYKEACGTMFCRKKIKISFALIFFAVSMTSCSSLPQLYQSMEDVANDDAISLMLSREALDGKKKVVVSLEVSP